MNTRVLGIFTCMERLILLRNHDELVGSSVAVREIRHPGICRLDALSLSNCPLGSEPTDSTIGATAGRPVVD